MKAKNKLSKLRERVCVICGKTFYKHIAPSEINQGRGIVCSRECKNVKNGIDKKKGEFKKCLTCGKEIWVRPSEIKKGGGKYCSKKCYHPVKKMEAISYDGYRVYSGKKVHRIIMEEYLGRKLLSSEIIHHIDGNKLNNDINNLKVMSRKEHSILHLKIDDGLTKNQRYELRKKGIIKPVFIKKKGVTNEKGTKTEAF